MTQSLHGITLLVHDYDDAIAFFTRALRFELCEDTPLGGGKRWVRVAPAGGAPHGAGLVLAQATTQSQRDSIGRQGGDRVLLFLHTSDFAADHRHMLAHGVCFLEEPRHEVYGTVAVFEDLVGNRWDLLQPRGAADGRERSVPGA